MTPLETATKARSDAIEAARLEYLAERAKVPDGDWTAVSRLLAEFQAKKDAADHRYWHDADKALDRVLNSLRRAA